MPRSADDIPAIKQHPRRAEPGKSPVSLRQGRNHGLRRTHVPTLLILLALIPAALLGCGIWESRVAARLASDINLSGSLRFRSLYVYEATHADPSRPTAHPGNAPADAHYVAMRSIREDLRRRYPDLVAQTDTAWHAFANAMDRTGTVDWPTTDRMRLAADNLTATLDEIAQWDNHETTFLFGAGIALLALALPWTFFLTNALRSAEAENFRQTGAFAQLSERYTNLFQNVPVACFAYDEAGRIIDWNRYSEAMLGKSREEVIGVFLWEVISRRERWDEAREQVRQVISGEALIGLEWIRVNADGKPATLVSNVYPLRDATGKVTGGVSVTADITLRRQAEEDQRRLLASIAESEQRLQNITSRAHCLLWESKVTEEPAAEDYTGPYWNEEQRTRLVWDTRILHEKETYRWLPFPHQEGDSFLTAWRESIPTDQMERMNALADRSLRENQSRYLQEFSCRLVDGSTCWLLESVEISRVGEGHFELVGICTDITQQKEAETRLRAVAEDLERSNRSLQEFASIASHDLKEPLRKIRTFGDMLRRRAANVLPPESVGYLDRMIGASERMQALIDGLLDYSRAARKPRAPRPIDLNETVVGVLSDLEAAIDRTGAQITVDPLPTLHVDPLQMRQLFQNLIGNAIKFHCPGQAPIVTVRAELPIETPNIARIIVADRGIGFDEKYVDRIFDMFEQLDSGQIESSEHGDAGTGVGLAICRKIVERHGGEIRATSRPGAGAIFTVTLPITGNS